MTKTVVSGALTLNQVTLKLYTHGLVPWEGYFKKKRNKSGKRLHFCKPSYTPIIFKSLCSFVGGSVAAICWNFNQHGGNSTCNKKELVLIASSASVCRGHGPGLTRPNVWHPFLSTNKSVSKMLLAQDCLLIETLCVALMGIVAVTTRMKDALLPPSLLSLSFFSVCHSLCRKWVPSNSVHQYCGESSGSQTWSRFPHSNTQWIQEEAFN